MLICRNCSQTFINDSAEIEETADCPRCQEEEKEEMK
jgi:predicted Zn-ribbon and HTH transcriptional regulator